MNLIMKRCLAALVLIAGLAACNKADNDVADKPVIHIAEEYTEIEGLNAGERLTIPVTVRSNVGLKRLAYYFITRTSNGTSSSEPIYFDRTDAPAEMMEEINFTVMDNFLSLVVIAFDLRHGNSEVHISTDNIRSIQTIRFKDNLRYRESVFEGKKLPIEGQVSSEHDLRSLSYQTIVAGTASAETALPLSNPKLAPFSFNVNVVKNLSAVVIRSLNQYDALVTDTFRIGNVQDDAVVMSLTGDQTSIQKLYVGANTISGNMFSGTAVTAFSYALKQGGSYGPEVTIPIGTPADEFAFSFGFTGTAGIQALRLTGTNAGGKNSSAEYMVGRIYTPLKEFRNVVLTTEIGPGKINFFAAYRAPHFFSIENAAPNDDMIDLGFFRYSASSNNIMPPAVYQAGAAYATALVPYMVGFDKAPYTLVTANRPSVNPISYDSLQWDTQLQDHIRNRVAGPVAQGGENYNIYGTNRRTNNVFNVGQGFYIGWGQWDPINNQSFGIVIVRNYTSSGGFATVTLDIKVPAEDQRTKYNPVSLFNYP